MREIHRLKRGLHLNKTPRGYHPDGGGLYLRVKENGTRSWVFRFTISKRAREAGLGAFPALSLQDAREVATEYRRLLARGIDPIAKRHAERDAGRRTAANVMTFRACAEKYLAAHEDGWKNPKHRAQWRSTLMTYAHPIIGDMPVLEVNTVAVMAVLEPIWKTKPETAHRLRGRIEQVLGSAYALMEVDRANPARWRGHLSGLLGKKTGAVKHHASMPYTDVPILMARLGEKNSTSARLLEFTILTASRKQESVGARFDEFDLESEVWTVPAIRMKGKKDEERPPHRVPLAPRSIAIFMEMQAQRQSDLLFPGQKPDQPISGESMDRLLEDMGHGDITVHGFRTSFRVWAAEKTDAPREVAEKAIAHKVGDETERAYARTDLLEKRRPLMVKWERFVCSKNITSTRRP